MRISDWSSDVCSSDLCVDRLENRKAFGKVLGQFQHWQFRMAERATGIENARNLYLKAALRKDSGIAFPEPEAGMAKYYRSEEHTSELQSLMSISYAGFCLKKKIHI